MIVTTTDTIVNCDHCRQIYQQLEWNLTPILPLFNQEYRLSLPAFTPLTTTTHFNLARR